MELGEKIKQLRKSRKMTLEEVGSAVGVGKSTVRKWEAGDIQNMRRDKIAKLAVALGTTPAYLMGWAECDEWSNTFRKNASFVIGCIDREDFRASGIDPSEFDPILEGNYPLSLAEASDIADQLGESLDELIELKNENTPQEDPRGEIGQQLREVITLMNALSDSKKIEALNYLRYLASASETE